MTATLAHGRFLTRRSFLVRAGQGTIALAVVSFVGACGPGASVARSDAAGRPSPAPTGPGGSSAAAGNSVAPSAGTRPSAEASGSGGGPTAAAGGVTWERVDLGFVSAYVLVRGGEAAVVDTGTPGSEDDIAAALERVGLGWDAVGHVILTHQHNDHAGSAAAVLTAAPDATAYAGAEDIPAISVPRDLVAVGDGDRVFDLAIVATPGHTPGHIAVLDEAGGVLVAGDALRTEGAKPAAPNVQFTADMAQARASIAKLAERSFETLLVGHGEPITAGAAGLVAELAAAG